MYNNINKLSTFVLLGGLAMNMQAQKKNVLFIMADDFNHWANCVGYYPQSITPNVDKLASKGVLFTEAHCSSPVCNPSRNALWSGLRPATTGISSNSGGYVREKVGFEDIVSMHQFFKEHGYYAYGGGKLWHPGSMGGDETDAENWSGLYTESTGSQGGSLDRWTSPSSVEGGLWTWGAGTFDVETSGDRKLARHMASFISTYNREEPFFLGCGFFRPHLPWNVHKQFWDLFDPDTLNIPQGYKANDLDDIPGASRATIHSEILTDDKWKEGIRAYLACLAFADENIGIVLEALENSSFDNNTIICFMGDHGWHLGEKERWSKYAVYDQANHTTLIVYDPSATGNGQVCRKVVSMQDLYPTLLSLTGFPNEELVEGRDISPLLQNPTHESWDWPILMTYNNINYIKTNKWRYINQGENSQLYDIVNDPFEWTNLYGIDGYDTIVLRLNQQIDSIVAIGQEIKDSLTSGSVNESKPLYIINKKSNTHLFSSDCAKPGVTDQLGESYKWMLNGSYLEFINCNLLRLKSDDGNTGFSLGNNFGSKTSWNRKNAGEGYFFLECQAFKGKYLKLNPDNSLQLVTGETSDAVKWKIENDIIHNSVKTPLNHYSLSFYPNPVGNTFTISCKDAKILSVEVYDLFGRRCQYENSSGNSEYLICEPNGIYILKVHTNKGEFVEKFTIRN